MDYPNKVKAIPFTDISKMNLHSKQFFSYYLFLNKFRIFLYYIPSFINDKVLKLMTLVHT